LRGVPAKAAADVCCVVKISQDHRRPRTYHAGCSGRDGSRHLAESLQL